MKIKKRTTQVEQLSFDLFFNDALDTIGRIQSDADSDADIEDVIGEQHARRTDSAVTDSATSIDATIAAVSAGPELPSTRVENTGPLGDEFAAEAASAGSAGRDSVPESPVGSTEDRNGHFDLGRIVGGEAAGTDGLRDPAAAAGGNRAELIPAGDYTITDADRLGEGGAKAKYRENIAALELLKELQFSNRVVTADDQAVLVRYVGWGGVPQAFDPENSSWQREYAELKALLNDDEYEDARRSTQDAHYTSTVVIDGIYSGLERFGFDGGRLLESAVGSGNFIGRMPQTIKDNSKVTGIELDTVTAGIAKKLYPTATIINKGFQEVAIPSNHFDAAIGNPPFGSQRLYDPNHKDLSEFSIHNYFLAKSLDKVREGGVIGVVVSSYFLDAQTKNAREHIAGQAKLVGAIRLPNTAFKQNALTDVTTDIVFLQKLTEGEEADKSWVETGEIIDQKSGKPITLNQYFIDKPSMMLGTMELTSGMFRDHPALIGHADQDLAKDLKAAIETLPQGIYTAREKQEIVAEVKPRIEFPKTLKIGAYFVAVDGRIARRLPDILDESDYEFVQVKNEKAVERIKGMIQIRDALRELMSAERHDSSSEHELDQLRGKLNTVYDSFAKKNGFISSQVNKQAMGEDPEYPLLHSLERDYDRGISKEIAKKEGVQPREPSASKASIFTKRVMTPTREISKVETAKDALVVSMNERGGVDLALMARISGKTEDAIVKELHGLIFLDPESKRWTSADKYLTGNVKAKLYRAVIEAEEDHRFAPNVEALQQVQPADIEPVDIAIQLGSTWIPAHVVNEFVTHLIGDVHRTIDYQPALGKWIAKIGRGDTTTMTSTWGTEEAPANNLIECILGNKSVQVKDLVGYDDFRNPIYRVNEDKTAAAAQKADEIRTAFLDWVWTAKDRRESLARIYNDRFNTNVAPKYDGSHLTLPGSSLAIELRPHQKDAIWRGIQDGGALFDHTVGAGKTMVCIGTAMESRRMGLMKKPMFVVPNHLLLQWKDAFYELYPNANILVAEKTDFKKENREKLFGRIATGDWDAVIVAHSSFKKIGMPQETLNEILNEQIEDLTDAIVGQKRTQGDRVTIKEMEKARDRMKAKLEKAAETGTKDKAVTFDDLGVDSLVVDESQVFKNLFITTSLNRISGLGNLAGSDQAFDLFVKARYLQKQNEGRGLFTATGTSISNTIAEVFTVQRYHMYDDMKLRGIVHFDAWASTFGQVVTGWELDATGVNYKLNSRFAKFQNVPELISQFRTFADVITKADLHRQAAEQGKRFPIPKIKGGKPENIIIERSDAQARYMGVQEAMFDDTTGLPQLREDGSPFMQFNKGSIIWRMENLPSDPSEDNPLKITNDARKAGLDFRLIDPNAEDVENSKVNTVAREVYKRYLQWNEKKGTQLVFCDLSTPKGAKSAPRAAAAANLSAENSEEEKEEEEVSISMDDLIAGSSKFSVYDDLKKKLIELGIPEHEIRFIHDAKTDAQKAKLFDQVNRGNVRVLAGSTAKMGAGTNVQRRLVAQHDIDAPWRPSDLEQRGGRIERQGNMFFDEDPDNFEIEMLRYATKQTYDSRMWQTIEYKAIGIEQFRRGDSLQRVIEDVAGEAANSAEMKAAATGNPLIFMQVKLSADLKKMEAVRANFDRSLHRLQSSIEWLSMADERADAEHARLRKLIEIRDSNTTKEWQFVTTSRNYTNDSKDALLTHVLDNMKLVLDRKEKANEPSAIGKYRGFPISVSKNSWGSVDFSIRMNGKDFRPTNLEYGPSDKFSVSGFISRLDNNLMDFESEIKWATNRRTNEKEELKKAQEEIGKSFPHQAKLEMLRKDSSDVLVELKKIQNNPSYVSDWVPMSESDSADEAKAIIKAAAGKSAELPAEIKGALDGWPTQEFKDIADEVERLKGQDITALGHVNALLVPAMASKWNVSEEKAVEVFNDWLKGNNRTVPDSLDLVGDQVRPKYHPDSIGRADSIVSRFLQAVQEPLQAAELLGSRNMDQLWEHGDGNEVHKVVLDHIADNKEFAQAVITNPGKRYASEAMRKLAAEVTGLKREALTAAEQAGFVLKATNRDDGNYTGKIISVSDRFVLQDIGMKQSVLHYLEDLTSVVRPKVGDNLQLSYRVGYAVVRDQGKQSGLER